MNEIEKRLERIERLMIIGTKEALNTQEVSLLLGISESRVRHLVSCRDIPHYKQGYKTYFKKSDIEQWQLSNRIPTNQEIKSKAVTYAVLNK